MIIIGAKGHAKDLLSVLNLNGFQGVLYFFDDISDDLPEFLYNKYSILNAMEEVCEIFKKDRSFAIGVGKPEHRFALSDKFKSLGGNLTSVISKHAHIGSHDVELGDGINIMTGAFLSNSVAIGEGVLINAGVLIHHDVNIGRYSEISPGAIVTGGVNIGEFTSIGAGAKLLPKIIVGNNVIIGAGAVVTKDIPSNSLAVGVPARII